ncbi:MAG TPA: ABC transporter permease [Terracidiphilus sp.]|nr:ABC transporter permease [Terracidiphilus sp.]
MTLWQKRGERLKDEMQSHIDFETQQNIEDGMEPDEARRAAVAKFGNILVARERSREVWGWLWAERLWQDIRYALRGFRRNPGFATVALLSLMLGIGASVALFSAVYGVLIAPYPYAKPDEIWAPTIVAPNYPTHAWHRYTRREFQEIQKLPAFSDVMATDVHSVLMTGDHSTESFYGVFLTGGAFNFIGVKPLIGRTIQPFDIRAGGRPSDVVVLTYGLWRRMFDGDRNVIGKTLVLDGVPHTIIGVMPPRFGWWTSEAFWLPMPMDDLSDETPIHVIMRLRPGITKGVAEQQLTELNSRLAQLNPQDFPKGQMHAVLNNYMDITQANGPMQSSLHLLLAAVGLLLLIACVNVANLQLARMSARSREIAMRMAIGAGRGRLVRQLLTESMLLSVLGGVLGVLFSFAVVRAIVALIPPDNVPNEARITINGYVLLFSLAVSMLTGILFGLVPALRSSRPDLADVLKDGGTGAGGSARGQATRSALVVLEITLSVILLTGASLATRSFIDQLRTDPGFQPERTLTVDLELQPDRYPTLEQRNSFDQNLLQNISSLPGVQAAALGNGGMPYSGWESSYTLEGQPQVQGRKVVISLISSNYLRTLGIPLKRGRDFTPAEVENGMHVALINESAARLWPAGTDPTNKTMQIDALGQPLKPPILVAPGIAPGVTIVGMIGDTKNDGMQDPTLPAVYVPYTLIAPPDRKLAVRTFGEPAGILNAVRQKIHDMDKGVAVSRPLTINEILGQEIEQPRFNMALFGGFAALGLALAAIGIYCVISYNVTQRMHEIGVRMALGASRSDILRWVLRAAAKLAGAGVLIGLSGSIALEKIVRFNVFGAAKFDAASLAAVLLLLTSVAMISAWLPARKAGRLDPLKALRQET